MKTPAWKRCRTRWPSRRGQPLRTLESSAIPLGLLWISVDQAHELRKSHGARACETMLEKVERTLAHGLKPAEEIGRWGDDEFLVLSHETSPIALAAHAQALAGLARTTDFRWWGDRLSLTVSIGAAQANSRRSLCRNCLNAPRQPCSRVFMRAATTSPLAPGRSIMFAIIGIVMVFGAVIGGFLMEKGHIAVLVQPAELLIICGASIGTLLVANPYAHSEGNHGRPEGRAEGFEVRQEALSEYAEDDVPVSEQGAQRRPAQRGDRCRETEGERDLQELSGVSGRSSRAATLFATRCAWRSRAGSIPSTWTR